MKPSNKTYKTPKEAILEYEATLKADAIEALKTFDDTPDSINYLFKHAQKKSTYSIAAFAQLKKIADETNGHTAESFVAFCYSNGYGITEDKKLAYEYYKKSAAGGNQYAIFNLAIFYCEGKSVDKNFDKAVKLFYKVASKGTINKTKKSAFNELKELADYHKNACAASAVCSCYEHGYGTEKNNYNAFKYFQTAHDGKYPSGSYHLACCYRDGIGTEQNLNMAINYFFKAAKKKKGVANKKAFEALKELADNDDAHAAYRIALCYIHGYSTGWGQNEKAFKYLQQAYNSDHPGATNELGDYYEYGASPVKKDHDKAAELYFRAAKIASEKGYEITRKKAFNNLTMLANVSKNAQVIYLLAEAYKNGYHHNTKSAKKDSQRAEEYINRTIKSLFRVISSDKKLKSKRNARLALISFVDKFGIERVLAHASSFAATKVLADYAVSKDRPNIFIPTYKYILAKSKSSRLKHATLIALIGKINTQKLLNLAYKTSLDVVMALADYSFNKKRPDIFIPAYEYILNSNEANPLQQKNALEKIEKFIEAEELFNGFAQDIEGDHIDKKHYNKAKEVYVAALITLLKKPKSRSGSIQKLMAFANRNNDPYLDKAKMALVPIALNREINRGMRRGTQFAKPRQWALDTLQELAQKGHAHSMWELGKQHLHAEKRFKKWKYEKASNDNRIERVSEGIVWQAKAIMAGYDEFRDEFINETLNYYIKNEDENEIKRTALHYKDILTSDEDLLLLLASAPPMESDDEAVAEEEPPLIVDEPPPSYEEAVRAMPTPQNQAPKRTLVDYVPDANQPIQSQVLYTGGLYAEINEKGLFSCSQEPAADSRHNLTTTPAFFSPAAPSEEPVAELTNGEAAEQKKEKHKEKKRVAMLAT